MQITGLLDLSIPKVMGILNLTPDSFYDGGKYQTIDAAVKKAVMMQEEGAEIIDIGGESARPGSDVIPLQQELHRVIPVIEKLKNEISIPISIDTYKPAVMRAAIQAGAVMINDTRALQEIGALQIIKENNVSVCLMHMQGEPKTMQQDPYYHNVVQEVYDFLAQRVQDCVDAGITKEKIMIDPGFGFGKTANHNLLLLKNLAVFRTIGCPILLGLSRKATIGLLLNQPVEKRLYGSLAATAIAINNGANIIRTHDVKPIVETITILNAILNCEA
jgi:dihydropteroate synthase